MKKMLRDWLLTVGVRQNLHGWKSVKELTENGVKRVDSITLYYRRIVQNSRRQCTSTRSSQRDVSIPTENTPGFCKHIFHSVLRRFLSGIQE
jgi:hypothetical protein